MTQLYATPSFQAAAGDTWRPGGLALTLHGVALCGLGPQDRVLDVGCGTGATLLALQERGISAVGVDKKTTKAAPGAAWEPSARHGRTLPLVCADASHLPFAAGSFDGLVCECVLSLLPDPEAALRGLAVLLRPGGRLLLSDLYRMDGESPAGGGRSCLEGACGLAEQQRRLAAAGWHLLIFEDHTRKLRELAARLVWYGGEGELSRWLAETGEQADATPCAGTCRRYGYGLWIAEREAP